MVQAVEMLQIGGGAVIVGLDPKAVVEFVRKQLLGSYESPMGSIASQPARS